MSIYAISDLHLSFSADKPMNIFGDKWNNYTDRLYENWQKSVQKDDVVIISGDTSWATYLDDCYADFNFINKLNGKKIIIKGNHDYWWTTLNKMNSFINENSFDSISFMQNNTVIHNSCAICGTRGWTIKTPNCSELNEKIFEREKRRLILSLEEAKRYNPKDIIVALHYPPCEKENDNIDFLDIMNQYGVKLCVYGHLHAHSQKRAITGVCEGVELRLVSCDYLEFMPEKLK